MNPQDPFFQAIREGNLGQTWDLISDHPHLVHAADDAGLSPLHLAARLNDRALAQVLLDYGADLESVHPPTFSTPLKHAVFFGNLDLVRYLVQRGALLDNRGGGSTTPLELARKAPTQHFRQMGTPGSDHDYASIARFLEDCATPAAKTASTVE